MKSVGHTPETKKYEAHFSSQALEIKVMDPILMERKRATPRLHQVGRKTSWMSTRCSWNILPTTPMENSYRLYNFILQKEVIFMKT
jgi:hypothetical protein